MSIAVAADTLNGQAPDLPVLREDLDLLPGPQSRDGAPTWTVYDPVRAKYFRISQLAFEMLSRWSLGSWQAIQDGVARTTGRRPTEAERDWLVRFLNVNMLVHREELSELSDLERVGRAAKLTWVKWALHHYLFFRIPLVHPQRFLNATLPAVRTLASSWVWAVFFVVGVVGVYLTLRQWDVYWATFVQFTSPAALVWYAFAIAFAKVVHELGHAYTAAHYGCRVPAMGVAFLVMWPVLYTDTSEAWRLQSKRQRLVIGAAGMLSEMALAVMATVLWSFLPDGPMRSAVFVLATVTWVMTLAINLNPFMRFDGYYLLSDALEVENLQDRAFAHARWWLRERLFALGDPAPEAFTVRMGRTLVSYAIATWIYRLLLFLGIAVLVYAFFFKALGIVLFVVELAWFVALPVVREGGVWWSKRGAFRFNRNTLITLGVGLFVLLAVMVPWRTSISLPAVWEAHTRTYVFAPTSAQVQDVRVQRDQQVVRGDVLAVLSSPDLEHEMRQAQLRVAQMQLQVRREAAGGPEAKNIRVLQRRLEGEIAHLSNLEKQRALLTVRAPHTGRVAELAVSLKKGVWVNSDTPLGLVVDASQTRVRGFVDERDVSDIAVGAHAKFIPEDPVRSIMQARVVGVDDVNARHLDSPYLASLHGGPIAVEKTDQNTLTPLTGIYPVSLELLEAYEAPGQVVRGTVHVQGPARSFAVRAGKRIWGVLVRESGF